jgi:hypothetical protein
MMALGGGVLAIGLLQAMDNLLSALYSFPGGYLVVTACMLTMLTVMVWVYQNFYYTLDFLYI